jgi:hypothetical protein
MKQNYRTKVGLGYEEAKFNYLNIITTANFLVFFNNNILSSDFENFIKF